MHLRLALDALDAAGITPKGVKAAQRLLATDPWPAGLELPTSNGQVVDQAELIGRLAADFVEGRVTGDQLPGRVAEIATERLGGQLWRQLHDRVQSSHQGSARRHLADEWKLIDKEITRREDSARKQRRDANRALDEAARLLGEMEITSRQYAARAGGKAVEAWDARADATARLKATYALRYTLSEIGIGDRPSHDYMQITGGRLVAAG